MYNQQANDIWLNRLRRFVAGRKVILVGNSPGILNADNGEFIDSFDCVVRFGKGVPTPELHRYIGNKTDVWFFGVLRTGHWVDFPKVKFKVFGYLQMGTYVANSDMLTRRVMFSNRFQVYRDYFLSDHIEGVMRAKARINGGRQYVDMDHRVSQGVYCLDWFLNNIGTQKETHLIGFDCQQMGFQYKTKDGAHKVSYSWHVPKSARDGAASQVHSPREGAYIEKLIDQKKIHFHAHDVNKCPVDILEKIAEKNRPGITDLGSMV